MSKGSSPSPRLGCVALFISPHQMINYDKPVSSLMEFAPSALARLSWRPLARQVRLPGTTYQKQFAVVRYRGTGLAMAGMGSKGKKIRTDKHLCDALRRHNPQVESSSWPE